MNPVNVPIVSAPAGEDSGGMCAATACPLIAPNGSPWTGEKDTPCKGGACGFFDAKQGSCDGSMFARQQVHEASTGTAPLQLAEDKGGRYAGKEGKTFDCPHVSNCRWQFDAKVQGAEMCPPRTALAMGLDPRYCLF